MGLTVDILARGVRIALLRDPEAASSSIAREAGGHLTPEDRAAIAGWRAGDAVFVQLSCFVEFDDGSGTKQRWDGTPQGPHAVPLGRSATTLLLELANGLDDPHLAAFGFSDLRVSRFDFYAAPRRIDVDPELAAKLVLD